MDTYKADTTTKQPLPFFWAKVPAGFPSPAADYEDDRLDLNQYLITNPPASYLIRATGDSMTGAGIHPGDLLIVDKSLKPQDGNVVIASVYSETTLKRLRMQNGKVWLQAEHPGYPPLYINEDMEFEIWGVDLHGHQERRRVVGSRSRTCDTVEAQQNTESILITLTLTQDLALNDKNKLTNWLAY